MAISISKEDLVKTVANVSTASSITGKTDSFSRLLDVLSNPTIQQMLMRVFDKIMPPANQNPAPAPVSNPNVFHSPQQASAEATIPKPAPVLNGEAVYKSVVEFLEGFSVGSSTMTVKELKDHMVNNKEKVIQIIETYSKGLMK